MTAEALKKKAEKVRYTLIPLEALEEVARVMEGGAKKYGERGWASQPEQSFIDALLRHAVKLGYGMTRDEETGLHQVAHIAANALILLAIAKEPTIFDFNKGTASNTGGGY